MEKICDTNKCTGCGACSSICPKDAIKLQENNEGFLYPIIDKTKCIDCGKCQKVCHINSMPLKYSSTFYMCWNKDEDIVKKSSSGGAFSAISKIILDKGGLVYGAYQSYNPNKVYHVSVEKFEDLDLLRLSKYNQSQLMNVYSEIEENLLNERYILFSGTACQVGGLKKYLSNTKAKNYFKYLYTIDVLCHGVTSQKIVDSYLKCQERKNRKKIKSYVFRTKENGEGWHSGCGRMKLTFDDNTCIISTIGNDMFFLGFNNNIFLRESCYSCQYCTKDRIADFTIADYWGVPVDSVSKKQLINGVSLLTVNSDKAFGIMDDLKKQMYMSEIDPTIAIANNRSFSKPPFRPVNRDRFFEVLDKKNYKYAIKVCLKKVYIKSIVKKILRKNGILKG